jgi:lysylphosphatidylglycerol synthetase-like protein (DUF2156 family)
MDADATKVDHCLLQPSNYDRKHLPELIRCWGGSTSITLLDSSCEIFSVPHIQGAIGFRQGGGCAVVFGDPVTSSADTPALATAFHKFAKDKGLSVIYATVSESYASWAMQNVCKGLIEVSEELIIDPQNNPATGNEGRMLRKKVKHATTERVESQEYTTNDKSIEHGIEEVANEWLKGRSGPQIYLAKVMLFDDRTGRRWFYATQNGKIVGALLLNQLEAYNGWVLYMLMATPEAANGTSEQLLMTALESLRNEGCRFLSLGGTPAEKIGEIQGFKPVSETIARFGFHASKRIFNLSGRRTYWMKYKPTALPTYILFDEAKLGLRKIFGLLKALNVSI